MKKIRADQLLVKQGLAVSRHQAQGLILAGRVSRPRGRVEKSGTLLEEETVLAVGKGAQFVSRGGIKLDHAFTTFGLSVTGRTCLDVGASTGGFTDCLLQRGAKKVYAVDVGYGQLDWNLRKDPRIALMERTNFRYLTAGKIDEPIDLAVIDVSFISLVKILPKVKELLKEGGEAIALVKPQFELSPSEVKKGVVRSEVLRRKAVDKIREAAEQLGFGIRGETPSPILGAKGNQEWFLFLNSRDFLDRDHVVSHDNHRYVSHRT